MQKATSLDTTWETPSEKQKELLQYLNNVQKSVNTSGSIKPKKLFQIIQVSSQSAVANI